MAAGSFSVVMDPHEVDGGVSADARGRLTVRFQGGAKSATVAGDLVVLDEFAREGAYAPAVSAGYVHTLKTDVPEGGDPADSAVGYEIRWFNGDGEARALFVGQPDGSTVNLSDLAITDTVPVAVSQGYALQAENSAADAAAAAATAVAATAGKVDKGRLVFDVKDYGATGNGTTDDTAAIQAAIDDAESPQARPGVVFFPSGDGPGAYKITSTLEVGQSGLVLSSPGRSTASAGARLVWAGASGGTMLSIDAERVQVQGLGFDGDDIAGTLIAATSKRGLQLVNIFGTGWTGTGTTAAGLMLGDSGANLNEFSCSGLHLQGTVAGTVGIVIDSTATERMLFTNTVLNVSPADVGMASWIITDSNVTFNGLTMDDGGMTDYAVKSSAGEVQLLGFASETPKLFWSAAAARQGITKLEGQARSLAPGSGEYAVHFQGAGHFHIEGRLQRKAGASFAPNVQIGSTVLGVVEEGLLWESADSGAVGTFVGSPSKVLSVARTRGVVESLSRASCWRVPNHTTRTTTAASLNRCLYVPMRVLKTVKFDRIACEVTTGIATGVTRLGLYRSADGLPAGFLYRSVNLDSSGTGEVGETFATPLTVEPGLYFVAIVAQTAAPTYRSSATYTELMASSSFTGTGSTASVYETGVTGALPSTAAATTEIGTAPLVALRVV